MWERKMTTLPEVGTGGGKGLQDTRKSQRDDSVVKWSPPKRKGNFRYSREELRNLVSNARSIVSSMSELVDANSHLAAMQKNSPESQQTPNKGVHQ